MEFTPEWTFNVRGIDKQRWREREKGGRRGEDIGIRAIFGEGRTDPQSKAAEEEEGEIVAQHTS